MEEVRGLPTPTEVWTESPKRSTQASPDTNSRVQVGSETDRTHRPVDVDRRPVSGTVRTCSRPQQEGRKVPRRDRDPPRSFCQRSRVLRSRSFWNGDGDSLPFLCLRKRMVFLNLIFIYFFYIPFQSL